MIQNSELLKMNNAAHLSSIDKQRRFILRTLIEKKGCPNCATPVNFFEAKEIYINDLDLVNGKEDDIGTCPKCKRGLERIVPLMGENWCWRLVPIKVD